MILIKGGYMPDVVIVQHGHPVRLNLRQEQTALGDGVAPGLREKRAAPDRRNRRRGIYPEGSGEYDIRLPDRYVSRQG